MNGDEAASRTKLIGSVRWGFRKAWSAHPRFIGILSLLAVTRGLFPAAFALVVRQLLNTAVSSGKAEIFRLLLPWFLLGLALALVEVAGALAVRYLAKHFTDEIDLTVTMQILRHASQMDVSHFENPRFQDIVHRAQENTSGHFSAFIIDSFTFLSQCLQALSLLVLLVSIEPLLIVVLVPLTVAQAVLQWRVSKIHYLLEYSRTRKRRWIHYFLTLFTGARVVPEVKLLALAQMLNDKSSRLLADFRDENRKKHQNAFYATFGMGFLSTLSFFALLADVVRRYLGGALTIGDVAIFGTIGLRLRGSLEVAVNSLTGVLEHALFVSNLREFLSAEPKLDDVAAPPRKEDATGDRPLEGEIEFRNVSFTYPGSDRAVLANVSFHLKPGETIALVGMNGSGKTTILKLIARFYRPDSGTILYDGKEASGFSTHHLHENIAFVFQNYAMYEATAADNIAYGDWKRLLDNRERVKEIAEKAGVRELIEALPEGYDTELGLRFGKQNLSDGQWQQIAIARAFARNAAILMLDEPASNLDAVAESELLERFLNLARGKTTILISHRFSTVRMAERILVLENGGIAASGTHDELVRQNGYYAKLYRIQSGEIELHSKE